MSQVPSISKSDRLKSIVKQELIKSKQDPVYFCEHILEYEVNWYNKPFLRCEAKQIIYRAGRQSGKSKTAAAKFLYIAMFAYKYNLPPDEVEALLVIASLKLEQAQLIIKEINNLVYKSDKIKLYIKNITKTYVEVWWANGKGYTTISCVALGDPKVKGSGTRGYSALVILVDEAAHLDSGSLFALYGGGAARDGMIIMCSTPNGNQGRFFETCKIAKMAEGAKAIDDIHSTDPNADWTQINAISKWNKHVSKDFLKRRRCEMSESLYKQEYEGEFIGFANYLFNRAALSKSISNPIEHTHKPHYSLGVDIAGEGKDANVFTVGRIDGGNGYTLISRESEVNMTTPKIAQKIREYKDMYSAELTNITLEKNGIGLGVYDIGITYGLDIEGLYVTAKMKAEMYVGAMTLFEKEMIHLDNVSYTDKLFTELQDVKKKYNSTGQMLIEHGDSKNNQNDNVSSFILSLNPLILNSGTSVIDMDEVLGRKPKSMLLGIGR